MSNQDQITGVVLAGGQSRRMRQDKGLLLYQNQPMVSYALAALAPVTNQLLISANQHLDQYREFGYPIITDQNASFDGPLAGILAALNATDSTILLVLPCDSPLVTTAHVTALLTALRQHAAEIAVAETNGRIHPVFLALRTDLKTGLQRYLQQGERKMQTWLYQHALVKVDFSTDAQCFVNINTAEDLAALPAKPTSGN